MGLDGRCIYPDIENIPDSKVNLCVDNLMKIYEETAEQKGVQAVFSDIAVHSDEGRFSVYEYIKNELIARGVPENEICFASDAQTPEQRKALFSQINSGEKRFVIAST
ncbi:MAG: hypothetical protein LBM93_09935, partial [Oscillospiraceae bacterium]|nr:hypothetical protein [Oscillospiraceae bacterium]